MIRFTLKCDNDHEFESWFASSAAYDTLRASGHVACAICGSSQVDKALMAPRIAPEGDDAPTQPPAPEREKPLSAPASPAEQALRAMREHVEKTSDYVGTRFASEARAMHDGTAPERSIYGEARPDEARKLIEDGVPVAPLPFRPNRKSN
ncbi:DUF1178 family protein [Pseudaestuariivita atlantica]|uniref:DUF1178 family protein n=1 Tax=Pseudaestuariivita atlantica TaxID=1317121 RepID=A0A0L1JSS8_9RHOB|nr:DUF1178 family protein [Pseudaestuariivita atlantica]KNG94839.1 hypothetical protein ATO11_05495 [Pseudaestuariivita atlantica]